MAHKLGLPLFLTAKHGDESSERENNRNRVFDHSDGWWKTQRMGAKELTTSE
jgi:hypothetical protein